MSAIEITDQTFDSILASSSKAILVDFGAEWCGPCKMMHPVVEMLAKEVDDKAIVGKVDVDLNPNTAARFGIRNLPTFLLFKDGKLVDRVVGAVPKSVLEDKMKPFL